MIRQLRAGEAVPAGEPKRYLSGSGYVRLRWQVAPMELVEVYEHRLVTGTVGQRVDVHHKNGKKDDNRIENLEVLTQREHRRHHGAEIARFPREEAADLYADGWSTLDLAAHYGVDASNISRGLRRAGFVLRDSGCGVRRPVDAESVRQRHLAGARAPQIALELGETPAVIRRVIRQLGLKAHRAGRPSRSEKGYVTVTEAA